MSEPIPPEGIARYVVAQAVWAPSVHNTQPWRFTADGRQISLYADVDRGLPVADPDGREFIRAQLSDGAYPHLVLRIGMITQAAVSVRRDPDDVLFPPGGDDVSAARYHALGRSLRRLRQGPIQIRIVGDDPLELTSEQIALEGANTSFQVHLRVAPEDFTPTYNGVQLATAPALAVAGNSQVGGKGPSPPVAGPFAGTSRSLPRMEWVQAIVRRPVMYPNSALSAGQLAIIAIVPVLCLAFWLIGVFVAAREPRRRDSSAGTASLPQHPADMDEPQRKAA